MKVLKVVVGVVSLLCTFPVFVVGYVWGICRWNYMIGRGCADALFIERRAR